MEDPRSGIAVRTPSLTPGARTGACRRTWRVKAADQVNTTRTESMNTVAGAPQSGFRPSSRSRLRIAVGAVLSMVAVGIVLLVFASADKRVAVLQVVRDLPAGTRLTTDDVRSIDVSTDPSLAVVRTVDLQGVVGHYTKVRIVSGGLLATGLLQGQPLVAPGSAVVAVTVPAGEVPAGIRERSQVQVVMPSAGNSHDVAPAAPVVGRVVGLPAAPDSVTGQMSLSLEVSAIDAVTVANAAAVRVVLLDPGVDPAGVVS